MFGDLVDKSKGLRCGVVASLGCRRPLDDAVLAEDFISKVFEGRSDVESIANLVANAELALLKLEKSPTQTHNNYRDKTYRDDVARMQLHERILNELINLEQLEDDDDICLGKGGAKPQFTKQDGVAYIVSGAPASGKSTISDQLAKDNGAYMLDSDYAKRKFPEYSRYSGGASLVHKESDELVFAPENSLFEYCIYSKHNIVIPLVGRTYKSVEKICKRLISAEYAIHIINVALDRYECTKRAFTRFQKKGRYVPLSYVFDEVGNEPERIYFQLKRDYLGKPGFLSFSQVSTDVQEGMPAKVLEKSEHSPFEGSAKL